MTANGLGPWWFPAVWREVLTRLSATFFDEANWTRHDRGYALGIKPRGVCDWKMFQASVRDASRTTRLHRMIACLALSFFFYGLVRGFGWLSYNGPVQRRFKTTIATLRVKLGLGPPTP